MNSIQAKCNCGAVKLEINAAPVAQFYCHCDDCQAVHGAAFVPIVMFPADSVKIVAGNASSYALKVNPRASCSRCGTRLYAEPPGMGLKGVVAAILPAGTFKPAYHIQCQHAQVPVRDELPHFKGFPAAFGGSDETVSW
jgi:hypothetical protein